MLAEALATLEETSQTHLPDRQTAKRPIRSPSISRQNRVGVDRGRAILVSADRGAERAVAASEPDETHTFVPSELSNAESVSGREQGLRFAAQRFGVRACISTHMHGQARRLTIEAMIDVKSRRRSGK